MIQYGTFERKEGDYDLQEVVKDYIPPKHTRNYYDLSYLKIVRTPNINRLINSKMVGEDYRHRVYFVIITPNRECYFGPLMMHFPDTQEGLNNAEKYADLIMSQYDKNRNVHPKRWVERFNNKNILP